jgi:hypothetical protein
MARIGEELRHAKLHSGCRVKLALTGPLLDRRAGTTWRKVAADIEAAAGGGDVAGAVIALRLVLALEGVECRPQ